MSEFWKNVWDDARRIASGSGRSVDQVLAEETPVIATPATEQPKEQAISLDSVIPSRQDRAVVVPVVMDGWSLLDKPDGEFVAPQGVGLVPCILQMPKSAARPKVITGNVINLNFVKMIAHTQGDDGVTYYIHLGKTSKAYADFFLLTRLAHCHYHVGTEIFGGKDVA